MTLEIEIEQFLVNHPYIIRPSFAQANIKRQQTKDKHRLDILIEYQKQFTIVEIKRIRINQHAVDQLSGYIKSFQTKLPLTQTHYLIGQPPMAELHYPSNIELLILGKDIPLHYLYDTHQRKYIRYDIEKAALAGRYDSERRFLL